MISALEFVYGQFHYRPVEKVVNQVAKIWNETTIGKNLQELLIDSCYSTDP